MSAITWPELALDDPRVVRTLRRWGHPYGWAKGSPATALLPGSDRDDSDCSGEAQEVLVEAGELDAGEPDRNSRGLAMICDPVAEGDEQPFDLAFYGEDNRITHVMVVVGRNAVLGASGGRSTTHGDDPRAFVQLHRLHYRPDLVCLGRIKAEHRPRRTS